MFTRRICHWRFMFPSAMSDLIGRVRRRRQRCPDPSRVPAPAQFKSAQTAQAELVICDYTIERTFAWLMKCRRLSRDYEALPCSSEAWIRLAMIGLMLRRLHPN